MITVKPICKKRPTKLNALSVAKVIKALLEGPCSITELQEVSGLGNHTICHYMVAMVKEHCAHVSAWEKDSMGRDALRVFSLGQGNTVKKSHKNKAQIAADRITRRTAKNLAAAFTNSAKITSKITTVNTNVQVIAN